MQDKQRYIAARRATIVNASINSLLAVLKVVIGIVGNSSALIADGIHSFSDLFTDALVLFAAKVGNQSPDKEHPYGHRRVETVSTIIISLVLIAVAIGIGYDTLHHIYSGEISLKPSYFVIIVAVISIFANEFLYHYTLYQANKSNSELLRSNAWHNRSDSLVSAVVLVSVIGSMLGAHYLDSIGALIIAILIFMMAIKMIWKSIKELIDTGVEEQLNKKISENILKIPGVSSIHQLRTRSHGSNVFLDVHIQVSPLISISEGHYISEQVNINLIKRFSNIVDVTVHIDPENDEEFSLSRDLPDRLQIELLLNERWSGVPSFVHVKKIILHYLNGEISAEVYLPLSEIQPDLDKTYQSLIQDLKYITKISVYFN